MAAKRRKSRKGIHDPIVLPILSLFAAINSETICLEPSLSKGLTRHATCAVWAAHE